MAIKYREMVAAAALTATPNTVLYVAPVGTGASIHAASAFNGTAAPISVRLYKVVSGGAAPAAGASSCVATVVVPAGVTRTLQDAINQKLESGSTLYADGNGASLTVSGVELVAE